MPERSTRRLAAILFTDMVGYTALMARDEALARRLRDRHREVLRINHDQHRGEILQYFGDGTLSIFHSAVEAVQCAIDMQRVFQEEPKVPLRIGIHSGEIVLEDEGIYGNAVNIASRMESFAETGAILVSSIIREQLSNQPTFQFQSLGLYELKNVPKPMEVFAVANEGIFVPRAIGLQGKGKRLVGNTPKTPARLEHFVGREKELVQLRQSWADAQSGKGTMIGIAGEPGIGKTTLVEDFLLEISEETRSFTIARGRCSERFVGTEAYLPFLEMLDGLIKNEKYAALLKHLAPAWYVQLRPYSAEESKVLSIAARASQERRKREVMAFLEVLGNSAPLILFIDDWHWADPSSVDLIAYIAPRLPNLSNLLLLTYRPTDMKQADHPFLQLKSEFEAKRLFQEIPLPFLKSEEISRYLKLKYPTNDFPFSFAKKVQDKTEGNPLFMVDLVEDFEERELIQREKSTWTFSSTKIDLEQELPTSIDSMIRRKISRLKQKDLRLLSLAAVQGYEFDVAVLAKVLSQDAMEIEDQLRKIESHFRLVKLVGEKSFPNGVFSEQFHFVHVLYRDALFNELSLGRKTNWCVQVAGILQQLYKGKEAEIASQLAPLYEWAQKSEVAIGQYKLAAVQASSINAFHETKALARKGLGLVNTLDSDGVEFSVELELISILASSSIATEGYAHPEILNLNTRALELCQKIEDPKKRIPVLLGLMVYYLMNADLQNVEEINDQVISLTQDFKHAGYLGTAYHYHGTALVMNGKVLLGRQKLETALGNFQKEPEKVKEVKQGNDVQIGAMCWTSFAYLLSGYPNESREINSKMFNRARSLEDHHYNLCYVLIGTSIPLLWLGNDILVLTQSQECIKIANEHDFPFWVAYGSVLQGWAKAHKTHDEEGLPLIETGRKNFMAMSGTHFHVYFTVLLAETYYTLGHTKKAWNTIEEGFEILQTTNEVFCAPELYRIKGVFLQENGGDLMETEQCYIQAIEIAQQHGTKWWELRSTVYLCRLWQQQGKRKKAFEKLKAIYYWFTEGFDTPDLQDAKTLLDELQE